MTVYEMQALIERLEGHLAWIDDFGPDGTLREDLPLTVEYLKKDLPDEGICHGDQGGGTVSEKQEHRQRLNERLAYAAAFERWLQEEPPRMFLWHWHRWKQRRPRLER